MVRAVHNERAKSAIHFSCSGDVTVTCSGDVPTVFQQPLEHYSNVGGRSYWNVAGTRILGLADTTLLRLFIGGDPGQGCTAASFGRATPRPYPAATHLQPPTSSVPAMTGQPPPPNQPFNQPARQAWAATAQQAPFAAPATPQLVNTNPNNGSNENKSKLVVDHPRCPCRRVARRGVKGWQHIWER